MERGPAWVDVPGFLVVRGMAKYEFPLGVLITIIANPIYGNHL